MKKRNGILIGLIVAALVMSAASFSRSNEPIASLGVGYVVDGIDTAIGFHTLAIDVPVRDITSGRARSLMVVVVGLISLICGGLALARAGRGSGNGRVAAIVALVLGLIGIILSVVHIAGSTGFGTGGGRAGAIVALVLALIGISLAGLALARISRERKT